MGPNLYSIKLCPENRGATGWGTTLKRSVMTQCSGSGEWQPT